MELMVFPRRLSLYWLRLWCYGSEDLWVALDWHKAWHGDQPSMLNWSSGKGIDRPRISKVGMLKARKSRLKRIMHFPEDSSGKRVLHVWDWTVRQNLAAKSQRMTREDTLFSSQCKKKKKKVAYSLHHVNYLARYIEIVYVYILIECTLINSYPSYNKKKAFLKTCFTFKIPWGFIIYIFERVRGQYRKEVCL